MKKGGAKRLSFSSKPRGEGSAAPAESAPFTPSAPAPVEPAVEIDTVEADPTAISEAPQSTKVLRSQLEADRARRLGERFKLPDLSAWKSPHPEKELVRVQKPIRMRIHRTCHKCDTPFGGTKVCVCGHSRCTACPRYPPRKDKTITKPAKSPARSDVIEVDHYHSLYRAEDYVLTMPSRTGGQALVRKKPVQRVRRTCHECSTTFQSGSKVCAQCTHRRCVDCPRDPAKKDKYPDGYPGDNPSSDPSKPVKFNCHKCNKTFPPVQPDEKEAADCERCKHQRCERCHRAPIRKVEPTPDPEVLRSLEAKLAGLKFTSPVDTKF